MNYLSGIKLIKGGKILGIDKKPTKDIDQKYNDYRVFSNYAGILQSIGKLKEAEISLRKAIELYPDYAKSD